MEAFAWMAWTWQTAVFFAAIACLLGIMTLLAIVRPEVERVGALGIATTRGDRLFIGLLTAAYIHLAWLFFTEDLLWIASGIALAVLAVVMRWG